MAVISPIAIFGLLPQGQTAPAAALMLVVAALDVVVAVCLVPVLRPGGRLLTRYAVGLRIAYAAMLTGAALILLSNGDPAQFDRYWGFALLAFGAHLMMVGVLAWRSPTMPRWLGVLVLIAGLGYLIDSTLAFITPSVFEVSTVTFVGEVALLLWLLIRARRR